MEIGPTTLKVMPPGDGTDKENLKCRPKRVSLTKWLGPGGGLPGGWEHGLEGENASYAGHNEPRVATSFSMPETIFMVTIGRPCRGAWFSNLAYGHDYGLKDLDFWAILLTIVNPATGVALCSKINLPPILNSDVSNMSMVAKGDREETFIFVHGEEGTSRRIPWSQNARGVRGPNAPGGCSDNQSLDELQEKVILWQRFRFLGKGDSHSNSRCRLVALTLIREAIDGNYTL
uniref:Uncharacterized protein n=1 Tax=Cannabis sativa TaxID=3483 RepID=A0A803PZ22_CANSA